MRSDGWVATPDPDQWVTVEGSYQAAPCSLLFTQNLDTDREDMYWVPKGIIEFTLDDASFWLILPGHGGRLLNAFKSRSDAENYYDAMETDEGQDG